MKNVEIVIHKEEVINDIVDIAHVIGRRLYTPDMLDKASDIQSPDEGPDKYILARSVQTAIENVKLKCARYLNMGKLSDDNSLEAMTGDFILKLNMPDTWNFAATAAVTLSIHNYMVNFSLYNIFEKTNPNEANNYMEKAHAGLQNIKGILELRTSYIERPCKNWY